MDSQSMDNERFVVNAYDTRHHSESVMSLEDVRAMDRQRYDHFLDVSRGVLEFRDGYGDWQKLDLWRTSLGSTPLRILFAMQLYAGSYVCCADLVELTGNEHLLVPGNVSRHLVTLRRVHQEAWQRPHFFVTRRSGGFAVMWPAARSFMRIERIDPALGRPACPSKGRPAA